VFLFWNRTIVSFFLFLFSSFDRLYFPLELSGIGKWGVSVCFAAIERLSDSVTLTSVTLCVYVCIGMDQH
jgi:hypothetical protein